MHAVPTLLNNISLRQVSGSRITASAGGREHGSAEQRKEQGLQNEQKFPLHAN